METTKRQQHYAGMIILAVTAWQAVSFSVYAAAGHTQFKPGEIWTDTS